MTETVPALLFYMFAAVLVLSSLMVVVSRNPVHSVLYLILAFFNAAGLFLLLGAEFVAFILVIVYVGAVAVLFLFVVMMLDIDFAELRKGAWKVWPVGLLVGGVLVAQLVITMMSWQSLPMTVADTGSVASMHESSLQQKNIKSTARVKNGSTEVVKTEENTPLVKSAPGEDNTHAIGTVLYTNYIYPFQVAGLILLVAMIGAIVLTHRIRSGTLRQNISKQISRNPKDAMEIRKVEKGAGVS